MSRVTVYVGRSAAVAWNTHLRSTVMAGVLVDDDATAAVLRTLVPLQTRGRMQDLVAKGRAKSAALERAVVAAKAREVRDWIMCDPIARQREVPVHVDAEALPGAILSGPMPSPAFVRALFAFRAARLDDLVKRGSVVMPDGWQWRPEGIMLIEGVEPVDEFVPRFPPADVIDALRGHGLCLRAELDTTGVGREARARCSPSAIHWSDLCLCK